MSPDRIRNTVEAALLAAGRPLALEALLELFEPPLPAGARGPTTDLVEGGPGELAAAGAALSGSSSASGGADGDPAAAGAVPDLGDATARPTRDQVREALGRLAEEYAGRGVELREVASGFRIQVRPEYARRLGRLWAERPARYSRALLETLALVAYRQPISRAEIEEVRGVSVSSSIFKTLQDREWVRVVGHRDTPGRPALYGTTRQFLDDFNLKQLSDLPPLSELQDPDRVTGDLFEVMVAGAAAPADGNEGAADEPPAAAAPEAGSGPGSETGAVSASESGVGAETRAASEPGGGS